MRATFPKPVHECCLNVYRLLHLLHDTEPLIQLTVALAPALQVMYICFVARALEAPVE
jgi:hypothetical protein